MAVHRSFNLRRHQKSTGGACGYLRGAVEQWSSCTLQRFHLEETISRSRISLGTWSSGVGKGLSCAFCHIRDVCRADEIDNRVFGCGAAAGNHLFDLKTKHFQRQSVTVSAWTEQEYET